MVDFSSLFPGRDLKEEWKYRADDNSIFPCPVRTLSHIIVDEERLLDFYNEHQSREHSVFEDEVIKYAWGQRYCSPDDYWPFVINLPTDLSVELQKKVDDERGIPWWEHQQSLSTRSRLWSLINLNDQYDPIIDERNYTKLPDGLRGTYIEELLGKFIALPVRARFVKLEPGQEVGKHIDYSPKYALKAHIPVKTNADSYMTFAEDGIKCHLPIGEVSIVNTAIMHDAVNFGETERIHLIVSLDGQGDIE
jgi:hypothetical protein